MSINIDGLVLPGAGCALWAAPGRKRLALLPPRDTVWARAPYKRSFSLTLGSMAFMVVADAGQGVLPVALGEAHPPCSFVDAFQGNMAAFNVDCMIVFCAVMLRTREKMELPVRPCWRACMPGRWDSPLATKPKGCSRNRPCNQHGNLPRWRRGEMSHKYFTFSGD